MFNVISIFVVTNKMDNGWSVFIQVIQKKVIFMSQKALFLSDCTNVWHLTSTCTEREGQKRTNRKTHNSRIETMVNSWLNTIYIKSGRHGNAFVIESQLVGIVRHPFFRVQTCSSEKQMHVNDATNITNMRHSFANNFLIAPFFAVLRS